jgi:hypothetical protein
MYKRAAGRNLRRAWPVAARRQFQNPGNTSRKRSWLLDDLLDLVEEARLLLEDLLGDLGRGDGDDARVRAARALEVLGELAEVLDDEKKLEKICRLM